MQRDILLFDLDGTLVDSAPDLRTALNRTIEEEGLPRVPAHEFTHMIGDGVARLVARAFAHASGTDWRHVGKDVPDPQRAQDRIQRFRAHYDLVMTDRTTLYPGMAKVLEELGLLGFIMAVCTNKPDADAARLIGALNLGRHFRIVAGPERVPDRKPAAAHLLSVLATLDAGRERAIMIGDGVNDVLAARAAGIPSIGAAYGYGARGEPFDIEISKPQELPEAIRALNER